MPKRTLIGEMLPWEDYIDDDPAVVLCTDNSVFAVFEVAGVYADTAEEIDLAIWFDEIHNVQKNIHAEDVELFTHKCRGYAERDRYPVPDHPNEAARDIDTEYREHLFSGDLFLNRLYLTVQIHAPPPAVQSVARFFADDPDPRSGIEERKNRLNELCELVRTQLSRFGLHRLGYAERPMGLFDEIGEAYAFATTGIPREVPATTGRMGNDMFSEDLHFRYRYIKIEGAGAPTYAVAFAIKNHGASTAPWMLQALDMAPYQCTVIQNFRFLSNAAASALITRKQNRMYYAGDPAKDQQADLERAHNRLLDQEFVLGDHSMLVLAFAPRRSMINTVANAVWRDLARCGMQAVRISGIMKAAFLAAFPGNVQWRPRSMVINSINYGALSPLYNWPEGSEKGNVAGPEIAVFRTLAGTPYRWHWGKDTGDILLNKNTLFTGEPGSGKTSLLALLIALSAERYRIMALDNKQGWRRLFEYLRGDYAVHGAGEPHLAPLRAYERSAGNKEFLIELWRGCIGDMTEEDGRRLALWINTVWPVLPRSKCTVGEMRAIFDNDPEGAGARLDKWIWPTGELGWVLDAPRHTVELSNLCCHDITKLLDNPRARGPALACLFHEMELALDGTPVLIPLEEVWRGLVDPTFQNFLANKIRTIRSKGGVMAFVTQSAKDIRDSGIAHLLVEMCPNAFHMANPRGRREDYIAVGLTDGQFDAFHQLQTGQGLFLMKQGVDTVIAQAPLPERLRPLLSASERDLRAVEDDDLRLAAE